jgi:outer membrane lipoprotein-sorting protein
MRIVSLVVFIFVSFAVFAQDDFITVGNPAELSGKIEQASAKVSSIKSGFVQQKHLSILEETLESKGNFLFKKENNVKWQYYEPFSYTIIVANAKYIIDNEGRTNVFDVNSNEMFRQINKMIVTAISGYFVGSSDFDLSLKQNSNLYLAMLKPVEESVSQMLESINIYFDKESLSVVKIKFVEPGGDYTLIVFKNRQENIEIPDDAFVLK